MCVQKRENRKLRDRKLGGSQPSVVKPAQMTRVLTGSQRITAARVIGCRHYRILVCSYTLPSATNRHPCSTSLAMSTPSNGVGGSPLVTTGLRPTTSRSSSLLQQVCGCALVSTRPRGNSRGRRQKGRKNAAP